MNCWARSPGGDALQTLTMTHYQHPALDGPNKLSSASQLPAATSSTQGACRATARAEQMLACLACASGRSSRSSSCSGSRSSASQDDLQPLLHGTVAICGTLEAPARSRRCVAEALTSSA